MPTQYHHTVKYINGRFKIMIGTPSEHGLESNMAHVFTQGEEQAVWWLVDCELDEAQMRAIIDDMLARWDDK